MMLAHHRLSKRFFKLLGALLAVVFGFWMGATFRVGMGWLAYPLQILAHVIIFGLVYFALQLSLGTVFKQPSASRDIYDGIWIMPFSWLLSTLLFSSIDSGTIVLLFVLFVLFTFVPYAIFSIASLSVYVFTGIGTCQLPLSTKFGYNIAQPDQSSLEMLKTLLDRAGFRAGRIILSTSQPVVAGYISARKGSLNLRLGYFESNHVTETAFVLHEVVDESVTGVSRKDEALDVQAEIDGLLGGWKTRNKIKSYAFKLPTQIRVDLLNGTLRIIEAELGPRKISFGELKSTILSYPKVHPGGWTLVVAIAASVITAIVTFILTQLFSHLFK